MPNDAGGMGDTAATAGAALPARPRRRWPLRLLRLVVLCALLAWLGRYAHLRLTVEPPLSLDDLWAGSSSPPTAAEAELEKLLEAVAAPVPFVPPAPPGMRWEWNADYSVGAMAPPGGPPFPFMGAIARGSAPPPSLELDDALLGPWDPDLRPHLAAIITYLQTPAVQEYIARLQARPHKPWPLLRRPQSMVDLREACRLLAVSARYHHAGEQDPAAAWADLRAGLWLARVPGFLLAFEGSCLDELRFMLQEHVVDAGLAAEIQRELAALPDPDDHWRAAMDWYLAQTLRVIDACYTRAPDGNGWLDLSRAASIQPFGTPERVWNLASVLYNDRRTVEQKARAYFAEVRKLKPSEHLSTAEFELRQVALGAFGDVEFRCPINECDGPLGASSLIRGVPNVFAHIAARSLMRQATRIAAALAQYRAEHGEYPRELVALMPECLLAAPPGPPFEYSAGDGMCSLSYDSITLTEPRGNARIEAHLVPAPVDVPLILEFVPQPSPQGPGPGDVDAGD